MITEIQAKKGKSIYDVISHLVPGSLEEERRIKVEEPSQLCAVLQKYDLIMKEGESSKRYHLTQKMKDVLPPPELDAFLQATAEYEQYPRYAWNTAAVLTHLIQNSYHASYNDFVINTSAIKSLDWFGGELKGHSKHRLLRLTIKGNMGDNMGRSSEFVHCKMEGDVGEYCGFSAEGCLFHAEGEVESFGIFDARSQRYVGNWGNTYKTPNLRTLEKMMQQITGLSTIIFIHPDGHEEVMRNYNYNDKPPK